MICVFSEEFKTEWPQVGQVVGITDTQITVRWYGQTKEGGKWEGGIKVLKPIHLSRITCLCIVFVSFSIVVGYFTLYVI